MFRLISLIIGYLLGCFQTAFFIGKYAYKIDIRDFGSKNSGATNATRVLGKKIGLFVFAVDIFKAVLGYIICSKLFLGTGTFFDSGNNFYLPGMYGGIGVILGHNFPFYLGFKGGKGSASGIGVILSFNIKIAIISYITGFITVGLTKYISLASMIVTFFFLLCTIYFKHSVETICLGLFMLLLSMYQHRSNIERILKGEENKFSLKNKTNMKKDEV